MGNEISIRDSQPPERMPAEVSSHYFIDLIEPVYAILVGCRLRKAFPQEYEMHKILDQFHHFRGGALDLGMAIGPSGQRRTALPDSPRILADMAQTLRNPAVAKHVQAFIDTQGIPPSGVDGLPPPDQKAMTNLMNVKTIAAELDKLAEVCRSIVERSNAGRPTEKWSNQVPKGIPEKGTGFSTSKGDDE